jgi:hypothetical protein
VPALPPGFTYLQVGAGNVARIGPQSTYVSFANGCAGSLPAARLVPLDTPRIGASLRVTLENLPANIAFLLQGFDNQNAPLGIDLAAFGMPGCALHTSIDTITLLFGSGGRAASAITVPGDAAFLGLHFYQQAFVLDAASGNALGAVMSDAAMGVVGDR